VTTQGHEASCAPQDGAQHDEAEQLQGMEEEDVAHLFLNHPARQRQDQHREDARHGALESASQKERPADEPVGGPHELHDLDGLPALFHGEADGIADDEQRGQQHENSDDQIHPEKGLGDPIESLDPLDLLRASCSPSSLDHRTRTGQV